MAQVDVTINGRIYQIACDEGQEEHLARLAEYVDRRVEELVSGVGQVGDSRLLVMVAMLIADELAEAYEQLKNVGEASADEASDVPTAEEIEAQAVRALDAAAERIAALASEISS